MIRISLAPPRCYLLGKRIHHGPVGILLTILGVIIAYSDKKDFPWPLNDK